jgi:hypothetical protein
MRKLPEIFKEVFDVRDTPSTRKWAWRIVWLILGGVILLGLLLTYQAASAAEFVPLSINSLRNADYSVDGRGLLIPAISMELVEDLIRDQEPTDVAARLAAVQSQLENTIPTATPRPTDTPSGDPTEAASSGGAQTQTSTPTSTAVSFVTYTPTLVISNNDAQATNNAATATSAAATSNASVPTSTQVVPTSTKDANATATFTKPASGPTATNVKPSPTPTNGDKPTSTPTSVSGTEPSKTPVPSKTPGSVNMTATNTVEPTKTAEATVTKAPTSTPKPSATATPIENACKDPDPEWGFVDWTNPEDGDIISPERSRLFIQFSQPINVDDLPKLIKIMGPGNLKYDFHYSQITRILVIDLKNGLEPAADYKLEISKNLENYCGVKQGETVEIEFKTWDWGDIGGN